MTTLTKQNKKTIKKQLDEAIALLFNHQDDLTEDQIFDLHNLLIELNPI